MAVNTFMVQSSPDELPLFSRRDPLSRDWWGVSFPLQKFGSCRELPRAEPGNTVARTT